MTTAVLLVQILVLMCSFALWRQGRVSQARIKGWLVGSTIAFILLFVAVYLPLFAFFIEDAPDAWHRLVRGYELHQPIKDFVDAKAKAGEVWGPKTLIAFFVDPTHDETSVWTAASVKTMRAVVLATWVLLFAIYAIAVSAFVSLQ